MKKDKEIKGIETNKGSEKDKYIIEGKCMMEVQSIKEDNMIIYNITEEDNCTRGAQNTCDNKDGIKYED